MSPVSTKRDLLRLLETHAATIRTFGVVRLGLFGSFVRDAATPHSDVDLLVEFADGQKTLRNLVGLSRFLQEQVGRKVELVTEAALNPFTGKYILQEVEDVALAA